MQKKLYFSIFVLALLLLNACASANNKSETKLNISEYYSRIYKSDSLLIAGDSLSSYKILDGIYHKNRFRKTPWVNEYEQYVILKDKYSILNKNEILDLISDYGINYNEIQENKAMKYLISKYRISSKEINNSYKIHSDKVNRNLRNAIDSIQKLDQEIRRKYNTEKEIRYIDSLNFEFFKKIFDKNIYPNYKVIGNYNEYNDKKGVSIGTLLNHFSYHGDYEYLKKKIYTFLINGQCNPIDYAEMVERHSEIFEKYYPYNLNNLKVSEDSLQFINKRRREIGLGSLEYENLKYKSLSN